MERKQRQQYNETEKILIQCPTSEHYMKWIEEKKPLYEKFGKPHKRTVKQSREYISALFTLMRESENWAAFLEEQTDSIVEQKFNHSEYTKEWRERTGYEGMKKRPKIQSY